MRLWGPQGLSLVQAVGIGDAKCFLPISPGQRSLADVTICSRSAVKTTSLGNSVSSPPPVCKVDGQERAKLNQTWQSDFYYRQERPMDGHGLCRSPGPSPLLGEAVCTFPTSWAAPMGAFSSSHSVLHSPLQGLEPVLAALEWMRRLENKEEALEKLEGLLELVARVKSHPHGLTDRCRPHPARVRVEMLQPLPRALSPGRTSTGFMPTGARLALWTHDTTHTPTPIVIQRPFLCYITQVLIPFHNLCTASYSS